MLFTTFEKPIVRNGKMNYKNFEELYSLMAKTDTRNEYNWYYDPAQVIPSEHSIIEWDDEKGFHYIMIDFLNGEGIILQQNGNDYRIAPN